jgi:hypothetical protein
MSVDSNWFGNHEIDEMGQDLLQLLKWRFEEVRTWATRDFQDLGKEFFWTESVQRVLERWWLPDPLVKTGAHELRTRTRTRTARAIVSDMADDRPVEERDLSPWDGGCCFLCCGMGAKFGTS